MSEVKTKVPQLRFPGFSDEWEEKKLGNISKLTSSKRVYLDDYVQSGIPFYRGKEISELQKGLTPKDILYISNESYEQYKSKYGIPQVDDILITAVGTLGNILRIKDRKPFYFKDGNLIWIKDIYEYSNFLEILLEVKNKEIQKTSIGSTQRALTMVELRKLLLPFPAKQEQQKIAAFLTAVDTKIEQLSKKQELLGEYKKGLMQQIFSQAIRFKADDGSTFPEWKEKKLGDIVRFENGKGHEQNISKDGKFIVVNSKFISSQGRVKKYTDTQKSPLNFGDVVMVMSDVPNGKALAKCYYIEQDNLYSLNQRICGLKHKLADTKFIYYRINRHKYFLSFDSGVGQTNLKKMEILNCPLNIPTDIKEQAKIANFLSSVDNKIEQVGKQLDESKQFKKALLQQMFV